MSIWSSVRLGANFMDPCPLDDIPERDNYTAEPDGACRYSISLATTRSWHDCIRFIADEVDHNQQVRINDTLTIPKTTNYVECLLTVGEARELVAHLEAAISYLTLKESDDPSES